MYGEYWKLTRPPFENSCHPDLFFRGRSHEAALLKLQYVIEQSKGVAVLVGEHGIGKTYVSRVLEAELQSVVAPTQDGEVRIGPVVRLMFPRLSADETLSYLLSGLTDGLTADNLAREEIVRRLEVALCKHGDSGRRPVFLIDDAHLVTSPEVLQVLAQVVAVCEVHGSPLCLVLLGQPELLAQVQRVPALNSRVAVRAALHPFSAEETAGYIRHRLAVCGITQCIFDEAALAAFHRLSLGFPRRINQLCDLALLVGYADGLPSLGSGEAEAAAAELLTVAID